MNSKKIEFGMRLPSFEKPGNMKDIIPEWYKKLEKFTGGKLDIEPSTVNVKSCIPFLDTYLTGYYVPTPVDFLVTEENGEVFVKWRKWEDPNVPLSSYVGVRGPEMTKGMPTPPGYHDKHFTWTTQLSLKCPKGYSLLITQPLNRFDLPTYTLTGIVDAENILQSGNLPFFVKKGFTGLIKAGTPIMQVIPIKNEPWKLVENENLYEEAELVAAKSSSRIIGFYKDNFWQKKQYS